MAEINESVAWACRPWDHQIALLTTIPGVGEHTAQVIVAETGADMYRFLPAGHLASWAGLAPALNQSAGKRTPAGSGHGNEGLRSVLVEAAASVGRSRKPNYLTSRYTRLAKR